MPDLSLIELAQRLSTFLWPMLRISALLVTAPFFSMQAVNLRVRIVFALVLSLMVHSLVDWPALDPLSAEGLRAAAGQVLIGAAMGLALQLVAAAVVVGGQSISLAIGLSMANTIDPNLGNVSVVSQFLLIVAVLVFLALGGHALLVSMLVESFRLFPADRALLVRDAIGDLVSWSGIMFAGGLLIALPVMAAMLVIQFGLGVVSRAAPSLNVFAVGFPALLLIGLVAMIVSMSGMTHRIEWLWLEGFARIRAMIGAG